MNTEKYKEMCELFEKFTNHTSNTCIREMTVKIKHFASQKEVEKHLKEINGTLPQYYNTVIRPLIAILADRVISLNMKNQLNWDYYYRAKAVAKELFEVTKQSNVEL